MRLLAITPKMDPADDLLGFVHTWMTRLAERVEHLYVLQLWTSACITQPSGLEGMERPDGSQARECASLPANVAVYSMNKGGGASKAKQLARFARVVGTLCLQHRVDAVLAHMGPVFAVCAAPFTRAARVPLALWYAHGTVSPILRLAHAVVNQVGTSSPAGFRLPSKKVRYTGQGIETDRFSPPATEPLNGPVVSVGRISPAKDYATLLQALAHLRELGLTPRLEVVGGAHTEPERRYLTSLRKLSATLDLADQVAFKQGVPHYALAPSYQGGALFASASRTGSLDKAVLEALSCGRIAITSNEAFSEFFGSDRARYTFPPRDARALARLLAEALQTAPAERRGCGLSLREKVIAEHGVDHLADQLVALFTTPSHFGTGEG